MKNVCRQVGRQTLACECRFAVMDFETTGAVAGWPVEPWQVGIVGLERGRVLSASGYETLMRVGERPFNPHAPGRHAQLRRELARAPSSGELWPRIANLIRGRPLVAHNVGTERSVLLKMAPLHRFDLWVDTLMLARRYYPALASKALDDIIPVLGLRERVDKLCPGRGAHDALYDAFACAVLLEHFLSLPGWERVTLGALI